MAQTDVTTAAHRILADRAARLAQQGSDETQHLGEALVVFRLGDSRYAVAARHVHTVHVLPAVTRLPGVPAWIVGLATVRSQLLSIVDIRPLLDLAPTPPYPDAVILVVTMGSSAIALLADVVEDVRRSDPGVQRLVSQQTGRGVAWVRGLDQTRTIVLDAVGLVQDPHLVVDADRGRSA